MQRISQFHKVSYEQFEKDWNETFEDQSCNNISAIYNSIKLPKRATVGSAGYDFFMPKDITLAPGRTIMIPTGIRVEMEHGWTGLIFPRSSMGIKQKMFISNTIPVVDNDYFFTVNEGHVFIQIENKGVREIKLQCNDRFVQMVFLQFGITLDDNTEGKRLGGIGSTDKCRLGK